MTTSSWRNVCGHPGSEQGDELKVHSRSYGTSASILALNRETSPRCTAAAAAFKQTDETDFFEMDIYEPTRL